MFSIDLYHIHLRSTIHIVSRVEPSTSQWPGKTPSEQVESVVVVVPPRCACALTHAPERQLPL